MTQPVWRTPAASDAQELRTSVHLAADSDAAAFQRRVALMLALVVGGVSLARDVLLLFVFHYGVSPDSFGYIQGLPIRTRPYPIAAALTAAGADPIYLVWLQLVLAAFAAGVAVFVIARLSLITAVLTGLLFLLDVNWAVYNRQILTESMYMSLSVLSLACLAFHYERWRTLRPMWLLAAGLLYGWTVLIRPSNIFLAVIIAAAYLGFTRSWRRTALVTAGIVLVFVSTAMITVAQTNHFRLNGETGVYLAFPLLGYHLFSAANGPASASIDRGIKACHPDVDYSAVEVGRTTDQYIWHDYLPCLKDQGWTNENISSTFTSAYVEAFVAHPRLWARSVLDWSVVFVDYPQTFGGDVRIEDCSYYTWCPAWQERVRSPSEATIYGTDWENSIAEQTRGWRQAYFFPRWVGPDSVVMIEVSAHGQLSWKIIVGTALLWIAIVAFLWLSTRGPLRFLALATAALVLYTSVSVAVGAAFIGRYVDVLTPSFAIMSAVVVGAVIRLLVTLGRTLSHPLPLAARRFLISAAATSVLAGLLYVVAPPLLWTPSLETRQVLSGGFRHIEGNGYVAPLPALPSIQSDTVTQANRSTLSLYEGARRLGPAHSLHSSIFEEGRGRYSHWTSGIYFSTSDNTDPSRNGRQYTVGYDRVPSQILVLPYLAVAALLVTPFVVVTRLRRRAEAALSQLIESR